MSKPLTLRKAAARLGVSWFVLDYAVRQHGPEPELRAGTTRLWSEEQLPALKASLEKTAGKPGPKPRKQSEATQ